MIDIGTKAIEQLLDGRRMELSADFESYWPDMDEWREAVQLAEEALAKKSIDRCDDPAILAIHEGIQCESNGFFCWHCDDMEWRWHRKVLEEVHMNDNIFLNERARRNWTLRDPPESWPGPAPVPAPPHVRHGSMDGKTPFQAMKAFIAATDDVRYALKDRQYTRTSDQDDFLKVWKIRQFLDATLPVDAARVAAIEALL
jgi:hypothetical protein